MGLRTPLYEEHVKAEAKLVPFAGWDMPLHYGSQLDEHRRIRSGVGMFDVSHMGPVDITGPEAEAYLRYLLANDVARLQHDGRALYTCMLDEQGGILDDLIVYRLEPEVYRVIVNAATREKDLAWMHRHVAEFKADVTERSDLGLLALQGPQAVDFLASVLDADEAAALYALKPFQAAQAAEGWVSRTGYTGEDGFEFMVPHASLVRLWRALRDAGVQPCGLGARDTLRLEAGLNLYGTDMDETTSPLTTGLGWTVAWQPEDRRFIGREALEAERDRGPAYRLVGLVLHERGVMRGGTEVKTAAGDGVVTSGSFAPVLERSIGLARIPAEARGEVRVVIRGKEMPAQVVRPPFVRKGKVCYRAEDE